MKSLEIENIITTNHDHDKYIATQDFNKLISENFTARLKQGNLASKSDISNFVKKDLHKNELSRKLLKINYQKKLKQYQEKY